MRLLLASCFAMVGLVAGCTSSADTPEAEGTFVTVEEEPQPNTLSREEVSDGCILLFDGETLFGWTPGDDSGWRVEDGAIACDGTAPSALKTTAQFADFELRWESWIDSESDAGVLVRASPEAASGEDGYEIQLNDGDDAFPTGSLASRARTEDSLSNAGTWRSYSAVVQGGEISVFSDGRQLAKYASDGDESPPIGCIGLLAEKGPVKFRNLCLRPLGTEPLFNDRDLTGWRPVPGGTSEFEAVVRGKSSFIYVHRAGGYLETEEKFDDFIFQAEISFNGQNYDGGVLFRAEDGTAEAPDFGYEMQLNNEVQPDDRTQPLNYGTGGLYGLVPARRQVARNFFWFTPTLVANGNHIAVWVDGIQVTDFTDTRPPSRNPREGSRTEAGRLSLQALGEETDLFFRNLRIARLPRRT